MAKMVVFSIVSSIPLNSTLDFSSYFFFFPFFLLRRKRKEKKILCIGEAVSVKRKQRNEEAET